MSERQAARSGARGGSPSSAPSSWAIIERQRPQLLGRPRVSIGAGLAQACDACGFTSPRCTAAFGDNLSCPEHVSRPRSGVRSPSSAGCYLGTGTRPPLVKSMRQQQRGASVGHANIELGASLDDPRTDSVKFGAPKCNHHRHCPPGLHLPKTAPPGGPKTPVRSQRVPNTRLETKSVNF